MARFGISMSASFNIDFNSDIGHLFKLSSNNSLYAVITDAKVCPNLTLSPANFTYSTSHPSGTEISPSRFKRKRTSLVLNFSIIISLEY